MILPGVKQLLYLFAMFIDFYHSASPITTYVVFLTDFLLPFTTFSM